MAQFDHVFADDKLRLLDRFPFFGSYLAALECIVKKRGTLGVAFDPNRRVWTLQINPKFYLSIKVQAHRLAVLIHEIMHVALLHPVRVKPGKKANLAADAVVNELICNIRRNGNEEFPMRKWFPTAIFYERLGLKPEPEDTFEKVLARLLAKEEEDRKNQNQNQQQEDDQEREDSDEDQDEQDQDDSEEDASEEDQDGEEDESEDGEDGGVEDEDGEDEGFPDGMFDEHDWDDLSPAEKELAETEARILTETVINSAAGSAPAEIINAIREALKAKVQWRKYLRSFGQSSVKSNYSWHPCRSSRRYGYPYPGRIKRTGGKIIVGVDVSGSVSEEDKKQFLGELTAIARLCDTEVVFFDAAIVQTIPKWRKGMALPNTNGGTDPQVVFDFAAKVEGKPSVVILTDGYFSKVQTHGLKTLFVITEHGQRRTEGQSIVME